MKQRIIHIWLWLCVLLFCFLSSGALLAQDEPADQTSQDISLLFRGTLNDNDADEGNYAIFSIALNAGDQITAIALCEAAADGARLIDPALTVSAPQIDEAQERQQWYNDDNDNVSDCVIIVLHKSRLRRPSAAIIDSSSRTSPAAAAPSRWRSSAAPRSRPNWISPHLRAMKSSSSKAVPKNNPKPLPSAADQEDLAATASSTTTVTFTGTLSETGGPIYYRYYDILANEGDNIVLKLICDEHDGGRPLDPFITTAGGFVEGSDEVGGVACDNDEANAVLEVTAAEDGPVYFTIFNDASVKAPYTLSISGSSATQPEADTPLWDGTGTDVPGSWATGNFGGGDGSLIVEITEGARVAALATCQENDDGGRPADPLMRVYDPATRDRPRGRLAYQACDEWYSTYIEFVALLRQLYLRGDRSHRRGG